MKQIKKMNVQSIMKFKEIKIIFILRNSIYNFKLIQFSIIETKTMIKVI